VFPLVKVPVGAFVFATKGATGVEFGVDESEAKELEDVPPLLVAVVVKV
jgi:hypothetical protein